MKSLGSLSFSVLALLLGTSAVATAAPASKPVGTVTGVALMPLETAPDDVAAGRQILAAVRDALDTTSGFAEKGPVEMGLDEARMSFSCFDEKPGCMAQVGALVDAKFLLWGKLTKSGTALRLEIHYVDVAKGTARTETFTESEPGAVDRLGRMAAEVVVGKRTPVLAPLSVRSLPAGAAVSIDGNPVGSTPIDLTLPPGLHTVEIKMSGMQSRRRTVELMAGAPTPLVVDERLKELAGAPLAAEQESPGQADEEPGGRRSTRFWLGVASAGVGAAGVASASIFGLKALDHKDWADKHKDSATDAEWKARSDELASTRLACNISWGLAAVGAGASAYFFLTDDSEGQAGAAIVPGPGSLGVFGRF